MWRSGTGGVEWTTPPLSDWQWVRVIEAVQQALSTVDVRAVEWLHGWSASDFDQAPEFEQLQWQTQQIKVTDLPWLLHERQRLGFCLGRDDLFLTLPSGTEIRLCHEGDLHLKTEDEAFAALLKQKLSVLEVQLERRATLSP